MSKAKPLRGQALRDVNSDISRLRKLGLYNGKAARGQPTAYALKQIKTYRKALDGTASVVSIPKSATKDLKEKYSVKRGKAVVPVDRTSGETARFDKSTKSIVKYGTDSSGKRYRREAVLKFRVSDPAIPGAHYILVMNRGNKRLPRNFDNKQELINYVQGSSIAANWQDWEDYVEIELPVVPKKRKKKV